MSAFNKRILRVLVCCLFLSFLVIPVFANYDNQNVENEASKVDIITSSTTTPTVDEANSSELKLFEEDFKEITEEELIALIKNDEVTTVSKYLETIFVSTVKGNEFQTDITDNIRNFLALKQIEIKK